jgi:DNA mismatch repair protein MutL
LDIIQLLPDHVANQIAAGEVIQRPASAVKEMLENALDAGSSELILFVKDAGKTLLQVVDNGCGMSKTDVRMCFERHATSKIKNINDLFSIQTMGFRGEAMASIAAIAHIEIDTKLTEEELGSHLIIEGSKIKTHDDCSTANGTSIKVKNLFYNVPARRNFLKSDTIEMRHITEEFTRIALANPEIKMQLFHNKNELLHLSKGNFKQRIVNIIGERKNKTLVPIEEETSLVQINGFIGKPESARKTRGEQYFFVNGRFIKNHYLHHAVSKAFEDLIPNNYFPSYFINLQIDPKLIDINIHPTKTEIKFEDEQAIYAIMRACIKRSLGQYNIAPTIDFSQELSFDIPLSMSKTATLKQPQIKVDTSYNPFEIAQQYPVKNQHQESQSEPQKLATQFTTEKDIDNIMQIGHKYIAFPTNEGMILLHQRRAHRRILFEYFSTMLAQNQGPSQQLLFPKEINLNKKDITIMNHLETDLLAVGFSFETQKNSISILGIPAECQEENLQFVIEHLIEQHKNNEQLQTTQNNNLAISLALSLAINKHKKLSNKEMIALKTELERCNTPSICPLGNTTMINLRTTDLEKYF